MSFSFASFFLWAQGAAPVLPGRMPPAWLFWLFVWGDPSYTVAGPWGGVLTWVKVVGLFCLMGWVGSWVLSAIKNPGRSRTRWPDLAALAALVVGLLAVVLRILEINNRMPLLPPRSPAALGLFAAVVVFLWIELRLWSSVRRLGRPADLTVLGAMHLALGVGVAVTVLMNAYGEGQVWSWPEAIFAGARIGATYMGLVALARVLMILTPELLALRARRLYAIAWQCWIESFRRMWAPWIVLIVFGIVLAFSAWFLNPRAAEMGRLYVGTLSLVCSLLLTVTVVILVPISLPNDIRQQTIYTIVSKPVRRLELIWGRMLGFMALVTVLLLVFGVISLFYISRQVGSELRTLNRQIVQAEKDNHREFALQLREQADQLRTRMTARVPVRGALSFIDSKGIPRQFGIDVGQEMRTRSFVEGATESKAIWRFGPRVRHPIRQDVVREVSVPVDDLLVPGTIEYVHNRMILLQDELAMSGRAPGRVATNPVQVQDEIKRLQQQLSDLEKQEKTLLAQGRTADASALRSPPIPVEMTFTVYRTTKGEIGQPVAASLVATNPRPGGPRILDIRPIREYYTNKWRLPSALLVGSHGELVIEVQCLDPNQYLGMAESDLFLLADQGGFQVNFMKGLFGIWLQAMVLTAIGVWAGTYLSWPVALLTTIWFFVAGQVGFTALQRFALAGDLLGGGPFVSLIRLLSHDNQISDLAPTMAVVVARALDSIVMPVMSRLVYLVPNFAALDVTNTVADGFAVTWGTLGANLLLALAYTLPFSIAGYFILKHREVAA